MQAQGERQLVALVSRAAEVLHNPSSTVEARAEAVAFFEQLKLESVDQTLQVTANLVSGPASTEVQVLGYRLLHNLVKNRWESCSDAEKAEISQWSMQRFTEVAPLPFSLLANQLALLLSLVIVRQGPQAYESAVPFLLQSAADHVHQAEATCAVLHYVIEDITQFDETDGALKRPFLAALTASISSVIPFLAEVLHTNYQSGVSSAQEGRLEDAKAHGSITQSALRTLTSMVEWAPMAQLQHHRVVDVAAFFLTSADFQRQAVEILRQISLRKKTTESADVYNLLLDHTGQALITAASYILQPHLISDLDWNGSLEEYGRQLCGALIHFGENHFHCISDILNQYQFLQNVLLFTEHSYLELSTMTLGFWAHIIREESHRRLGTLPNTSPPTSAKCSSNHLVPPEALQALMKILAQKLVQWSNLIENGGEDLPLYIDTYQELKDLAGSYRGAVKGIVKGATAVIPHSAIQIVQTFLWQTTELCKQGVQVQNKEVHSSMEMSVSMLEAVVSVLYEKPIARSEDVLDELQKMLHMVMAMQLSDPHMLLLVARGLESFARFLELRPLLTPSLINAPLELLNLLPLEGSGQQPPPSQVTSQWKEAATARIGLSRVLLSVAKAVPKVLIPHLSDHATRIQELWNNGMIRHGEKNYLFEGLVAAAAATSVQMQSQVLEWVLNATRRAWTASGWRDTVATPEMFATTYMSFEIQASGSIVIGSRAERWTLYHQIALLERVARQLSASSVSGTTGYTVQSHCLDSHLEWILIPVSSIVRSLHGLWTANIKQGTLKLMPGAFEMDPIERALRTGEDRESVKKGWEDAGTLAGTNQSALRYWLRAIREGVYMLLSLVGHQSQAMWLSRDLSMMLPAAIVSHIEDMDGRHLRMLIRHVIIHWVSDCPQASSRKKWLLPVLSTLLPHMYAVLTKGWRTLAEESFHPEKENDRQLSDEVVADVLLRELTSDYMNLLIKICEDSTIARHEIEKPAVEHACKESILETLWNSEKRAAQAAVITIIAALSWPHTEAVRKATILCRYVAQLAEQDNHVDLRVLVVKDILSAAVVSLVDTKSVTIQPDILQLVRNILVAWLPRSEEVGQLLMSLPHVDAQVLSNFQNALFATSSEKEQRNMIKNLIAEAGGESVKVVLGLTNSSSTVKNMTDQPQRAKVATTEDTSNLEPYLSSILWDQ